ncbi:4-phosphoerythronate dehydrogenase [Mariprofundus erugo]|uniref:4-phosphoerythronate dehydrogenase n=1 Tax=Mariprofundus erugo TaxID=2528639 RepID=A0A5R9GRX4_9PROT|nr:4-phosphoerythronate dehydrogenase [Mariprofundus erugo]TLS68991.1 4-phosphoerythronate dehydrogenase [Mariprofundus erugo]
MTSPHLKIVADAHIWGVENAFSRLPGYEVELCCVESRAINRQLLMDADILLTRSSTRVDAALLDGSRVRFAATATIGDDHYDKHWLDQQGIGWANAAGSSTGSVIEYMTTLLLELHVQNMISIPDTTIGIIGAGRIGARLASLCQKLGMKVMVNDPPRQRAEGNHSFYELNELLEQADLITLHTPLIRHGQDCTHHLIGKTELEQFNGRGIINAARGSCIDNQALLHWLDGDSTRFAALDCWEYEPTPMQALLAHPGMVIATPHIAGHSLDGKAANTAFAYLALCRFLNIEPTWQMAHDLPEAQNIKVIIPSGEPWFTLHTAATALYPLADDHATMKSWLDLTDDELPNAFSGYRRHYPVRRAWQQAPVHFSSGICAETRHLTHVIGLKTV